MTACKPSKLPGVSDDVLEAAAEVGLICEAAPSRVPTGAVSSCGRLGGFAHSLLATGKSMAKMHPFSGMFRAWMSPPFACTP
jgi:hypothetical protein